MLEKLKKFLKFGAIVALAFKTLEFFISGFELLHGGAGSKAETKE